MQIGIRTFDHSLVVYILLRSGEPTMPTRLQLARKDIFRLFEGRSDTVHKQRDLERILSENRDGWRLAQGTSFREFLEYVLTTRGLHRVEFPFPHRREVRYTWGKVPLEVVLLSLKESCHFSHFTAVQMHELTEQDPQTIYLNHEQPPKAAPELGLAQERIDLAFHRKPRVTRNTAVVRGTGRKGTRVCLLNGKHTGNLGVEEREVQREGGGKPVRLRLTDVERTLIDIAVRPFYAGGVAEVLKAYERAAPHVSVNRLAAMLRKLGYIYPYHQAVGFYLEAAGEYKRSALELFHARFEYEFDFYLTYGMKETQYVPRWRIHVPRGLNRPGL
jgi:hypothetical protein